MGFTGNTSGVRKVLIVFVILFLAGALGWCEARAESADAGLSIGFGKAAVGSEACFDSMLIAQELAGARWIATLETHGTGRCRNQDLAANLGAGVSRMTHLRSWAFAVGAGLLEHGDLAVGPAGNPERPQLCANLLIRRYLFRDRAVLDLLHCSTGGSSAHNPGLNFLTLGFRIR